MIVDTLWQDLRYALRTLRKNPGFAAVAVLTLAIGVGANTAIFSLINGILLKPIPAAQPEQLVRFLSTNDRAPTRRVFSYPNYSDFREQNAAFSDLVAVTQAPISLRSGEQSGQLLAEVVSGNYFSALGVRTTQGRAFSAEEDRPGADRVTVVSDYLWKRRFGADRSLVGKSLELNGELYTVVGIAPAEYSGIMAGIGIDVWVPISQAANWVAPDLFSNREIGTVQVLGRLRPGISLTQARAAMSARAQQLVQSFPDANRGAGVRLEPAKYLDNSLRGPIAAFLSIVLGLVGLVLLIVCANLTNLLLVRQVGRRHEMALRQALGASRLRLTRQLLTESVLLAVAGGALGTLLGAWGGSLITRFNPLPETIPLRFDLGIDHRVLLFAFISSLLAGVLLGLVPAFQMSKLNLLAAFQEGSATLAGQRRSRTRNAFIVAQVAVSATLLISAGLFLRSLGRAQSMDIGFEADHALAMDVDLKLKGWSQEKGTEFYREMIRRVEALPGIRSAALANLAPLDTATAYAEVLVPGHEPARGEGGSRISFDRISTGYFDTMGIPLRRGRAFTDQDNVTRPGVAVINETMARAYWPGVNPLGKQLRRVRGKNSFQTLEVVGIARDAKYRSLGEEPAPHIYVAFLQDYSPAMTLLVRTAGDAGAVLPMVERELENQDAGVHGFFARTLVQHIGLALLPARLAAGLSGIMAGIALLLAMMGLYGVVSYSVRQRTHEIGLRMALGARQKDVLRLILTDGAKLAGIGIALGLAGALALTRLLAGLLYGVSAGDPVTFGGVAALLAVVALLACYIPARRATRVDPLVALRYE